MIFGALLQIGGPGGSLATPSVEDISQSFFEQPIVQVVWPIVLFGLVVVLALWLIRWYVRAKHRVPVALEHVVLLVTVPKEAAQDEHQPSDPRELLSVAETLYANLAGIKAEQHANILTNAWYNFLYGRTDHLAFEIVAQKGLIKFYMAVPRHLQQLLESQVQAQYPMAHIEEVPDYNIFPPQGYVAGSYLTLAKASAYPIRSYRTLESDPLNALTNVMSKLDPNEGAAIQMVLRPAGTSWQKSGHAIARRIQDGKPVGQGNSGAMSVLGATFRTLQSSVSGTSEADRRQRMEREMTPYQMTPAEQSKVEAIGVKSSKSGFHVNIRVIAASQTLARARMIHQAVVNAFSQYTSPESGNGFRQRSLLSKTRFVRDFVYRSFNEGRRYVLNTEELASLYHLPSATIETPNILWLGARKAPPPVNVPQEGLLLGTNIYRGARTPIRISREDRRRHAYIIGITGTGKSVEMQEMAKQDIRNGEGVCVIDPHGDLVEHLLGSIPEERMKDVVLFEPADTERPIGLNMLDAEGEEQIDFAIQEMIAIFYKLFPPEMIGPMFEHNMRNVMLTLAADREAPGTIVDIPRMFTDKTFQRYKLSKVQDPVVRAFWEKEMAQTSDFHKSEMLGYLISKVGRFVENRMMRNIIGQPHSGFDFRKIMDEQKILLVNLSKGRTGEVNSNLLGLILVTKLQMAAMSRAALPETERKDFYLYIDEFQNFITPSIATILSEARKYRLCLTLAHQYLGQLIEDGKSTMRDAVLGTVGTLLAFRVGGRCRSFCSTVFTGL
ncbi:MAG: DUF853 family protein [Candidatus Nomurabacteria bacterium]|nr:MAG: DUF853 family protein [Candidatus Nomurabacteria bacterium]